VVLLEAMSARTAIVASDLPGYRNVATPDVDAVLVPPGDPAALARGITAVLSDGSLAARLEAAGEERAWAFSMDSLAERYAEIYAACL
jgi:glycosyltransferase involved in cell wall biosynthesis